jgi:hypothetical protein
MNINYFLSISFSTAQQKGGWQWRGPAEQREKIDSEEEEEQHT